MMGTARIIKPFDFNQVSIMHSLSLRQEYDHGYITIGSVFGRLLLVEKENDGHGPNGGWWWMRSASFIHFMQRKLRLVYASLCHCRYAALLTQKRSGN
jgi:hypothetical protein